MQGDLGRYGEVWGDTGRCGCLVVQLVRARGAGERRLATALLHRARSLVDRGVERALLGLARVGGGVRARLRGEGLGLTAARPLGAA